MTEHATRLVPLHSLAGYRLAEGEPDVRGWALVGPGGVRLGVVDELLLDPAADEVAALAVTTERGAFVLPMEDARIDVDRRAVRADLARARPAAPAAPARTTAAAGHPGVTVERTADGEEIVRVPIVREELVVERRPVVKEVLVIRKRAAQEQRVVETDLRRERLEVDRSDLDRRGPG
jgi:hypothetical protein